MSQRVSLHVWKALPALALLALGMQPANADRLADIKARGSLSCATLTTTEPLGFQDPTTRQIVGFDVDVCAGIAKHMGVKLELQPVSVEARIAQLALGRVDLVNAALGYTKERAEQIAFTSAHYQVPIKIIVKKNANIKTFADLAGKRISANKGSTPEQNARRVIPTAEVITYQDGPTAFLALQQNKVSGYAVTQFAGLRFVKDAPDEVQFMDESLAWELEAIGVKKDEPALLAAANKALEEMEAAGELDALWTKWYGPSTKYNVPREKKLTPIPQS
jgi:polar amino acid transport system substrate-binding protein